MLEMVMAELQAGNDLKDKSIKKLRLKRDAFTKRIMSLVAPIVKSWYLKESVHFLNERKLSESEENLLADFTEFCIEKLDIVNNSRNQAFKNSYPL